MKITDQTITILKNFSTINQSLLFRKGNILRTISPMKNILAEAQVTEKFPIDFGIYELNQFLNGLELHDNPDLDFTNDNYVRIHENNITSKYFFADSSVIITPPEKEIQLPSQDVCFVLETKTLTTLLKASSVYQLPDLSVIGRSGKVYLAVRDKKNSSSNEFTDVVGVTDKDFIFNFKIENLRIINEKYNVVISKDLVALFSTEKLNLKYWIALEPDSTYGK